METYVGATLRREFDINGISNKEGRYMIAKLEEEGQTAYIVVAVLQKVTDVHIIEMKAMDTDKVALNTQMLTDGLEKDGAVVLDGIYFDTDKATLKPSSKPAMDQIAAFLQAKPDLKVFVVGHTDMQGRLQHNMVLSQARAEAVVAALVNDYGLDGSRLAGHGVGSLAPASNNQTETGRAKNRRVVLVAQ
jgi:OOP family OmpA-OmpF porin